LFGICFQVTQEEAPEVVGGTPLTSVRTYVRIISTYEYLSMFRLERDLAFLYAKQLNLAGHFDPFIVGLPGRTSEFLLTLVLDDLVAIRNLTSFTMDPTGEVSCSDTVSMLLSGSTTLHLPDEKMWRDELGRDAVCSRLLQLIQQPELRTKRELMDAIPPVYRQPMRDGYIREDGGYLYFMDPIPESTELLKLQIVPKGLWNVLFTAFHVNPMGGHLGVYYTLHKLRTRYHWPGMFKYVKTMIAKCAACVMNNASQRCKSEFVYSFPVDAPFRVIHADVWMPGDTQSFDGPNALMIVMDHMSTFVIVEPIIDNLSSTSFAKALSKILLQFGLAHTCVIDDDSKFKAEFTATMKLLKVQLHLLAKGNHNGMLVERFNRFLNDALTIFLNDRDSTRTFLEGAYLTAYAWNSAPVLGTDMSRSLVAIGREFNFPIDFVTPSSRVYSHSVSPSMVETYTHQMLGLLKKCQEIYKILISEHRAMHRELRNSQLPEPFQFHVGDFVLAKKQVKSVKASGRVAKLEYNINGPWQVIDTLPGGSYLLESVTTTKQIRKKGSELYLCPRHVVPFAPLEGSDLSFGNINRKLADDPYQAIGISGFKPLILPSQNPSLAPAASSDHAASAALSRLVDTSVVLESSIEPFPTLDDLDREYTELAPQTVLPPPLSQDTGKEVLSPASFRRSTSFSGQPPSPSDLGSALVLSTDRLFFICFKLPTSEYKEWRVVQVQFDTSCSLRSSCLTTGQYLCHFLICHPDDKGYDPVNQRYWTEYHEQVSSTQLGSLFHLVRPTEASSAYLASKKLVPFSMWINLCHSDVFLHGPFDFATFFRKSKDRISRQDWQSLAILKESHKYDNPAPCLDSANSSAFVVDSPSHLVASNKRIDRTIACFYGQHDPQDDCCTTNAACYNFIPQTLETVT